MYCEFRPDRRGVFAPGSYCKPWTVCRTRGAWLHPSRWTSLRSSSGSPVCRHPLVRVA